MKKKITIKDQNGATVVEFALVLPLLVVFIFGIIEFSLLLYNKAMITNASREGARAGIVFAPNRPIEADIRAVVDHYAATHLINFDPSQVLVFDNPPPQHTPAGGTSPADDINVDAAIAAGIISSGDSLRVNVQYDYHFLIFPNVMELIKGSYTHSILLKAVTIMKYE